jgi:hypothetical protein
VKGEERSERSITSWNEREREKWTTDHIWECKGKREVEDKSPLGVKGEQRSEQSITSGSEGGDDQSSLGLQEEERSGQFITSESVGGREKWTINHL